MDIVKRLRHCAEELTEGELGWPGHYLEAAAEITSLRAELEARDGFVMVPVEPTIKMTAAGFHEYVLRPFGTDGMELIDHCYRAMIAARPQIVKE